MDPTTIAAMAQLAMSLGHKYFGEKPKNPADAAKPYLDQIPGVAQGAFGDYMNQGKQYGSVIQKYKDMYEDPQKFFNDITSNYKQSPGYEKTMREAMGAISNQAAAGGLAGAPQSQTIAGEKAAEIANADFQQYFNNVMGITNAGTAGAESGMNRGLSAAEQYANMIANALGAQAGYGYAGQANQNTANAQDWSNIFKTAGQIFPWMFGQEPNLLPPRSIG